MSERGGIINGLAQQSQSKTPHSLAQLTITWIMNMNEHALLDRRDYLANNTIPLSLSVDF